MGRQRLIGRREELGLTREQVAERLHCDPKTYARYERGETTPRPGLRPRLASALEWTTADLALALNDDGRLTPAPNGHAVPGWLGHLASLEQAAAAICAFEPVVVHGLLQTPGYAAAVERVGPGVRPPEEEIARRVETRIARQGVLTRAPDPLDLMIVLDESVLHRIAGGPDVMRRQIDYLVEMVSLPNVDVRILPLTAGVFSAAFGAFQVLTSPNATAPFMACVEDRSGPHYLDRPHEVEAHASLFDYLSAVALPPAATIDLMRSVSKEYE